MTKRRCKALTTAAGIAGPVIAIPSSRRRIERQLFEAWPYSAGIAGACKLRLNGMHVLAEIGLADELIR